MKDKDGIMTNGNDMFNNAFVEDLFQEIPVYGT
jgi:hypothetical protein